MNFILDASALLSRPRLFALGDRNTKFYLPQISSNELRHGRFGNEFGILLNQALSSGRLYILPHPNSDLAEIPADLRGRMSGEDTLVLLTVLNFQRDHAGVEVPFITDDTELAGFSTRMGIRTFTSRTIDTLVQVNLGNSDADANITRAASVVSSHIRKYWIGSSIATLFVSGLLSASWILRHKIGEGLSGWGFAFSAALAGVLLFLFRSRARLAYGAVEILFGCYSAKQVAGDLKLDPGPLIAVAASLYIIVRGLDNIESGLSGTRFANKWKAFFKGSGAGGM